jgi:serine phosphatase RsbU (regulator of sigma subunit)
MKVIVFGDDLHIVKEANLKIDAGIAYEIEYRVLVKDKIKWIEEKSSPIYDGKGKLIRNSGIMADITERKENEDLLRKKNKNITDSILYARTIQDAILVPKDEIAKKLNDFFILLKPKDIVSGDFYFYKETKNGIILAVADCTGHGVPAGFLSMIGNAFLNEIVSTNQIISPSQILDQLSEKIIRSLNQNRSDSESKDGMDISLLCFDNELKYVQYAGAQNSLYVISNGELKETKGDPFPIGISEIDKLSPFTNNRINLQKGDSIYIFSDGYADQFSGPERKKFMKKQMKELLTSIQTKKMMEQQIILDQTFNNWKGNLDQVDDVLVIGVRI